jgi:hypothetical protein
LHITGKLFCNCEIVLIRPRGPILGFVEAPDGDAAISKAIEEFGITDPKMQKRLSAQLVS